MPDQPPQPAARLPALTFALLAASLVATAWRTHNDTTLAITAARCAPRTP